MAEPLPSSEEEVLFRHVDPNYVDPETGVPSSQAFRPKPSDSGGMSVDLGRFTDAPSSHEYFTKEVGGRTAGVYAMTTEACAAESLNAYHQPKIDPPPNEAHGIVDFSPHPEKKWRGKGQRLRDKAKRVYPAVYIPPLLDASK